VQTPDEAYRRAQVDTASVPRAILLLYDKLLQVLEQAQAASTLNPHAARQRLSIASQILTHLLAIFIHSHDEAYQQLYLSHEQLSQKLSRLFRQGGSDPQAIAEFTHTLRTYRETWRKQLKILPPRQRKRPGTLNVRFKAPEPEN